MYSQQRAIPKRWLRFSLRTLFVLLTLLGIWLGIQTKWAKDRTSYLEEHQYARSQPWKGDEIASAPRFLWLWGDPGVTRLKVQAPGFWDQKEFHRTNAGPEAAEARELFPEAIIEVLDDDVLYYTWKPGEEWNWGNLR